MKSKDKKSTQELSLENLHKRLDELKKEHLDLLLQQKIRKIKNVHIVNQKRKEIAQIKTFINMKSQAEGK